MMHLSSGVRVKSAEASDACVCLGPSLNFTSSKNRVGEQLVRDTAPLLIDEHGGGGQIPRATHETEERL